MAKKKSSTPSMDLMPIVLIAGVGIGGYFLWKYFKDEEPEDPEVGFNITNYQIPKNALTGSEISIVIIAQNNLEEDIDGFCKIINLDNQSTLYYEHAIVGITPQTKIYTFNFITTMPFTEFNLRITTGSHTTQEIHSVLDWTINLGEVLGMKITEHVVEVI